MRVYLSSHRLGRRAGMLSHDGGRALIVTNALDVYDQRLLSWDREVEDLARLGYQSEELDLREHWGSPSRSLRDRLAVADLLWVVGGNAFVLARAATAASLRAALTDAPHITYAGYSAGACLASIDLLGIECMDDPSTLPEGYSDSMRVATLDLTGNRLVPHAGSPDATAAAQVLRSRSERFVELVDGEDLFLGSLPAPAHDLG